VTAGWWHHACARLADGAVRCWGSNPWGQLGNGTTTGSTVPVPMALPGITWTSSNTAVATIDAAGRATGVAPGVVTITARDVSGATASTTLAVQPMRVTLTVTKTGWAQGLGTIDSTPGGISCGADCAADYDAGTVVTLTASPGVLLSSWTGCDSVSGNTCTVTMSAARSVTATFMGTQP
jgi:hypothetical protein